MTRASRDKNEIIQFDFRKTLESSFEERRARKKGAYSFRSYARYLGLDPATLRKIITGKRPLGERLIKRLASRLDLPPDRTEQFLKAHRTRKKLGTLSTDPVKPSYQDLDEKALQVLSSWQGYALLSLMDLEVFQAKTAWVAQALKLPESEVVQLVRNMQHVGLLSVEKDGTWSRGVESTSADPSDPKLALLRHLVMQNILEKAKQAHASVPRDRRTFQAQTLAIDESLLPEAVEKIRAFRTELNHFLQNSGRPPNQVYELAIGLYPLSHVGYE